MRLVLASTSPSRKALLESAGANPVIVPPQVDEDALLATLSDLLPAQVVEALAEAKLASVADDYPDDVVIACDSMLLIDGELQGKPLTYEETVKRWQFQRGRKADLLSGHCIRTPDGTTKTFTSRTQIHFGQVSDADIKRYAASGEPLNSAGAFTLEAMGGWFIDQIIGDYAGALGLSLQLIRQALYAAGYSVADFLPPATPDK
ncbi:Maf family protein [Corynebacterium choanae]|uniref:Nucleoside triphosphate pyrophosphatase n=1 Tax=Corynebacterium choanae TaxID=1862358 RepID=A0A3G6JAA1_9CORY|nr:nucleoside triphosphate pyrophosphatase [Corynebacterium choanae]AZA12884.1 Septum formation protein Maf [Corynebacterium choanae]